MSSPLHRRAHQILVRVFAELQRRRPGGGLVVGHHNRNHILPLGKPLAYLLQLDSADAHAKFRVPVKTVEVVPRLWRESEVLRAVSGGVGEVPRCLADFGAWSLQGYLAGRALAEETPNGPIGRARLEALAHIFAQLAALPEDVLPQRPADWPVSEDSTGFLHRLAAFTEERVHQANRPRFGQLFDAVGVPSNAVDRFRRLWPQLTPRPFALLHTDIHRANVVVMSQAEGEQLCVIDWELALYGDPLHDLATHLVRMDYDVSEHDLMIELWSDAMRAVDREKATAGMEFDLRGYLDFEYVQSIYPDVMRAALALPDEAEAEHFAQGAERVCRALRRAWSPLGMKGEPVDELTAASALRQWHAGDKAAGVGGISRFLARHRRRLLDRCPDADQPRGAARRLLTVPEREPAVDMGELLEGLERNGC
ncbi:aminoglycoside phosphotransferase family protein [Streptomyces sp. S3(2020)]|uniref:phosphotransferase family protein n=1 Tax=Streptomyces sp. S3(2020) TaxID=2732044 RepID=UPI0014899F95|nr:aminoglycoside phosphotransferase family protein [Streptomyces sp. S3(2020)]NNN34518.1 aminoglycoside phosphotransferase family protein [Streptomyces sp. S3(2020)]